MSNDPDTVNSRDRSSEGDCNGQESRAKTPLISRPNPDHWYWHIFIVMRLNYNRRGSQTITTATAHIHIYIYIDHKDLAHNSLSHPSIIYTYRHIFIAVKNAVSDPQNSFVVCYMEE